MTATAGARVAGVVAAGLVHTGGARTLATLVLNLLQDLAVDGGPQEAFIPGTSGKTRHPSGVIGRIERVCVRAGHRARALQELNRGSGS